MVEGGGRSPASGRWRGCCRGAAMSSGPCIALAGFWQQAPLKRGYEPHHPCHVGRSHWRSIALLPVPRAAD
jgi:hypothetical protein